MTEEVEPVVSGSADTPEVGRHSRWSLRYQGTFVRSELEKLWTKTETVTKLSWFPDKEFSCKEVFCVNINTFSIICFYTTHISMKYFHLCNIIIIFPFWFSTYSYLHLSLSLEVLSISFGSLRRSSLINSYLLLRLFTHSILFMY